MFVLIGSVKALNSYEIKGKKLYKVFYKIIYRTLLLLSIFVNLNIIIFFLLDQVFAQNSTNLKIILWFSMGYLRKQK
jgi:hypothetical protein